MYMSADNVALLGCLYLATIVAYSRAASSAKLSAAQADATSDRAIQSSSAGNDEVDKAGTPVSVQKEHAPNNSTPPAKQKKKNKKKKKRRKQPAETSKLPGGSSRAVIGDPTNPHPATKIIWRNDVNSQYQALDVPSSNPIPLDPYDLRLTGLGVQIGDHHVLADRNSYIDSTIKAGDPEFSPVNGKQLAPRKIDVLNPSRELTNPDGQKFELIPHPGLQDIGGTELGLFNVTDDGFAFRRPQTAAKVETNPLEFGRNSDCFVHGYGAPVEGSSRSGVGPHPVFGSAERTYVKAPLDMSQTQCGMVASDPHLCQLSTKGTKNYRVCPQGRGMPVYCGKEEKLTYMSAYEPKETCNDYFSAYHIPRLVGQLGLPSLGGK